MIKLLRRPFVRIPGRIWRPERFDLGGEHLGYYEEREKNCY